MKRVRLLVSSVSGRNWHRMTHHLQMIKCETLGEAARNPMTLQVQTVTVFHEYFKIIITRKESRVELLI